MKSKKSFFNKTIFWKNMTLYWPIWVIYTLVLLFMQPISLWIRCYNAQYYESYTYGEHLQDLIYVIYLDTHIYLIAVVAIITGMTLFNYLYSHKSANMIHALPVDRTQLFGTNVLSGLLFLAVPQTVSAILTVVVALCNGIMEVHYVGYWLLLALGTDIVAMAIVTFCAMFTGHIVALPVYAIILNYLSYWVYYIVYVIVAMFGYGVNDMGVGTQRVALLFSPTEAFFNSIGLCENFDKKGECIGVLVYGVEVLAVYLVVALVLYVVAYMTYQKRHIEQAGEFITVGWVKPVFRFGMGATGGFFGGMMMREFLCAVGIGCKLPVFILIMLVIGAITYFVADMLIHKSFRVFKKRNWIGCGIFSVVMICAFFGMYGYAKSCEDYQPELDEIAKASVNLGYEIQLEGEEIATVLELHDEILANKAICIEEEENGNWDYEYVSIYYTLKNGDYITRSYQLPKGYAEIDKILEKISVMEQDIDNYLTYTFVKDYEQIEIFNGGWLEVQFSRNEIGVYDTIDINSKQAEELFEAVKADAKAGTLMKYNVYYMGSHGEKTWYSEVNLLLEFQAPGVNHKTQLAIEENSFTYPSTAITYEEEFENWSSAYITFGPDCENIVNKLIEFGYIKSIDDIYWGEIESE